MSYKPEGYYYDGLDECRTKRAVKCGGCGEIIPKGTDCIEVACFIQTNTRIIGRGYFRKFHNEQCVKKVELEPNIIKPIKETQKKRFRRR
jgi:hypothetical protein